MVFTWTYKNKEKKVKRKELLIVKARKSVLEMLKGVFQKKKRKKKGTLQEARCCQQVEDQMSIKHKDRRGRCLTSWKAGWVGEGRGWSGLY